MSMLLRRFSKKATAVPKIQASKKNVHVQLRGYDAMVIDHFNNPRNVGTLDSVLFTFYINVIIY